MADMRWIGGTLSTAAVYDVAVSASLAVVTNWRVGSSVTPSTRIPNGSDNIWITGDSTTSILSDLTTLSTVTGELHITNTYSQAVGSSTAGYLEMKPAESYLGSAGQVYADVKASTGPVTITQTATPAVGDVGLRLKGSAISTISMEGGTVGLAHELGATATAATIRVLSGSLTLGEGVTYGSASLRSGSLIVKCASSTSDIEVFGGSFYGFEEWQVDDLTVFGGTAYTGGSGAIDGLTINGGTVNAAQSGIARTYTTVTQNGGTFKYDPDVVTITNHGAPDAPVSIVARSI